MAPTKIFVGNLSFKTKEAELADEFSTAGKVLTANIITRGYRSLGYGFVEFETDEEAQIALNTLNKRNINGREINVEIATPREEGAPRPSRPPRRGGLRGRGGYPRDGPYPPRDGPYPPRDGPYPPRDNDSPNAGERRGGYRGRGPYRGNRNNSAPGSPAPEGNNQGPISPSNENYESQGQRTSSRGRNNYRGRGASYRTPRAQNVNRILSTTTLFVANLPYQLTDEDFLTLLPKASKAYVAKNYNGRSKGFGFIEFANEDDQKTALNASENLQVQGRDLIVKIAMTPDPQQNQ